MLESGELSPLFPIAARFFVTTILWQEGEGALGRVWFYITHRFSFGNIGVSLASLIGSIVLLILTVVLSRTFGAILERRIAKRAYIDPGLRYTMVRMARYSLVIVGVILALNLGFNINFTSLAVVFTALSVGIRFG